MPPWLSRPRASFPEAGLPLWPCWACLLYRQKGTHAARPKRLLDCALVCVQLDMYDDHYAEAQPSSGTLGLNTDNAVLLPAGRSRSKASAVSIGLPAAAPLLEDIGSHNAGGGGSSLDSGEDDVSTLQGGGGHGGAGMLQPGFEVDRRAQERAAAYVVEQGHGASGEEASLRFGMA